MHPCSSFPQHPHQQATLNFSCLTAEVMKCHRKSDEALGQRPARSSYFTLKQASSCLCHHHESSHTWPCYFLFHLQKNGKGSNSFNSLTFFLFQGYSWLGTTECLSQTIPEEKRMDFTTLEAESCRRALGRGSVG